VGLVLDTGGLIAFDRGDRDVAALVEATRRRRGRIVTSSGCVAQAWRGGSRQALLARLLAGVDERGLDDTVSRTIGGLCATTRAADAIDGHVALLAHDSDIVLTGDVRDIKAFLRGRDCRAEVRRC